jgi:hypothetical protein
VRPMIPAGGGCAVLVTSRQLLLTLDGAFHLPLGPLTSHEALDLLGRHAGADRIGAEPGAAASIARSCGNLPLALRIAGARLASRRDGQVSRLALRLSDEHRRLDTLQFEDLAIRASFQVSYRLLLSSSREEDRSAARAVRLLSLLKAPDIGLPAAAALLDQPRPQAEKALERLLDVHLLESGLPDRYRMHDLLRLFAREVAAREETAASQVAAMRRTVTWYLLAARSADRLLQPGGAPRREPAVRCRVRQSFRRPRVAGR